MTAMLISHENAYIRKLVLPRHAYHQEACRRAFGRDGRMEGASHCLPKDFLFRPFAYEVTGQLFEYSKNHARERRQTVQGWNISGIWTQTWQETLSKGIVHGKKSDDPNRASRLSRRGMTQLFMKILTTHLPELDQGWGTYCDIKNSDGHLRLRKEAKSVMRDKICEDSDFGYPPDISDAFSNYNRSSFVQ
ncbi:uncharacterized protein KY384_000882 [Bacidia gigantensis]|uniref:uncharacterized protein n=1 Tax=Bacidia gigantensis TaxID=2732470 RepID=UPI001D058E13|nr:uncharacterized protein KY384_000882 [Bacidia gigantensis]KAG8534039.1 hypothetical protein KY384_000882 [Bacidia gigantensis]